jgi:hypothetical protein
MLRKYIAILLFMLPVIQITAQEDVQSDTENERLRLRLEKRNRINEMIRNEEEGFPAFRKQFTFQIKSSHDGYGATFEKGWTKSPYKLNFLQLELATKRHEKELRTVKTSISGYFNSPSYVYGKQNNFYQARLNFGKQILVGGKSNKNGVGVFFNYAFGFSAGLVRPYYLDFLVTEPFDSASLIVVDIVPIKFQESQKEDFLNETFIEGGTGLKYGWNEMTFVPGFHAKTSLRFDWARFNQVISALEFGFEFEYFTQKIVQMVENPGRNFFPTGYIALVFGNRK